MWNLINHSARLLFPLFLLAIASSCPPAQSLVECDHENDCLDDNQYCRLTPDTDLDGLCDEKCTVQIGDHSAQSACNWDTDCDSQDCDNDTADASCTCVGGGTGGTGGSAGTGGSGGGGPSCTCPGPDCVEFSDEQFGLNDWTSQVVAKSGTNDYDVDQRSDDGNPRPYRFVSHILGENSSIWVAHEKPDASYEPGSDGAIESIHYSVDGKALATSRQASLKALAKQDDQWFWTTNLVLINEGDWETKQWTDETLGPVGGGALNLENGAPITFGFYTGASHTGGLFEVTRNTGVDNWRVVICKQPSSP